MRVEVDRDRCEGNAVCVGIAPELFELDDEDYAIVTADPMPAEPFGEFDADHLQVDRQMVVRLLRRLDT